MIPLHALVLILMGRFSDRLYVAYSTWYAIGTLASMQVPFVGFQPVSTSEHMGALGRCSLILWKYRVEMTVFRCIWTSADRRIRATCTNPCIVSTVPKITSSCRGRHWLPRRIRLCILDVYGKDCTLDWSFLLAMGYWICQKVNIDSKSCILN
jgi:hypothetical protein